MLLQGANNYNNQIRVGLCSEYSLISDYYSVIGNFAKYSSSTTEIRTDDIRTTTSDTLNNTLANNSRVNNLNQWYHMVLTISETSAIFIVTDMNGNTITLSATLPENALKPYWNNIAFSKC